MPIPEGPRPPMRENQRNRVRMTALDVHEVNWHTVDVDTELRKGVHAFFMDSPVVFVRPIGHDLRQPLLLDPIAPTCVTEVAGPRGRIEAAAHVIETLVGYFDPERFGRHSYSSNS